MQVEHRYDAHEGADEEIDQVMCGRNGNRLVSEVAVGKTGDAGDEIAVELESISFPIDVRDLMCDVVVENVQKT